MSLKSSIISAAVRSYRAVFARERCWKWNLFVYDLALRGMGILNYEDDEVSGERNFLRGYLGSRTNSVVIDVGANRGKYASLVVDLQPTAVVYAIEPHPVSFGRLVKEKKGKNVKVFNLACDSASGSIVIHDYADDSGSEHATLYGEALSDNGAGKTASHTVRAVTLDEFIRENSIGEIDLLKIDVEGNEFNVLKGCMETIGKKMIKAIHFEFNEMNIYSRTFLKDFVSALPDYIFFRLLPSGMVQIRDYRPVLHEIFAFQNIVAIHRAWMDQRIQTIVSQR